MEDEVWLGSARRLSSAYSALVEKLYYPGSEGDSPYQPFHAPLAEDVELSPDTFRSASGVDTTWEVVLSDGDVWFDHMIANARDPRYRNDPEEAVAYELLRRTMRATLTGPIQAGVAIPPPEGGYADTPHYIFGRLDGGGIVGLVAYSVET